jgi:hypothetical protein
LLSCCFSSCWRFDSSHRDRTTCTTCPLRILRVALLQPSKRNRLASRAFGLRRRRPPTPSAAACLTPPPPSWAPGLPDRDGRRPGPCRAKIQRVSPVWTACRSCGPAYDVLRSRRGRAFSSSAIRCLAVFRCAAADSVYGGSKTGGSSVSGRDSTRARLCQRAQATSTRWPLSEVRLPACVRRVFGLRRFPMLLATLPNAIRF